MLLMKDKAWEVISKTSAPQPEDASYAAWIEKDEHALTMINMLVEDSQSIHIIDATTTKEAREILAEYNQKSSLSRKISLRKKLFKLSFFERGNMEEHIVEFLSVKNQLAFIGKKFDDDDLTAILLSSLPDSYNTLVTTLENRPEEEITLDFIKGKLIEEYRWRKERGEAEKFEQEGECVEKAMKAEARFNKSVVECFRCHGKGHFKRECPGYSAWLSKQGKTEEKTEERTTLAAEIGNRSDYCFHFKESNKRKETVDYDKWLIDSGASNHVSNNREFFKDLTPEEGFMVLANQAEAKIVGKGSREINFWLGSKKKHVTVSEVRYIPSFFYQYIVRETIDQKRF